MCGASIKQLPACALLPYTWCYTTVQLIASGLTRLAVTEVWFFPVPCGIAHSQSKASRITTRSYLFNDAAINTDLIVGNPTSSWRPGVIAVRCTDGKLLWTHATNCTRQTIAKPFDYERPNAVLSVIREFFLAPTSLIQWHYIALAILKMELEAMQYDSARLLATSKSFHSQSPSARVTICINFVINHWLS